MGRWDEWMHGAERRRVIRGTFRAAVLHMNTRVTFRRWILLMFVLATTAGAATLTVTNTADSSVGSLRRAIGSAASGDTIIFASNLSGATITLTSGHVFIGKNLTIDGSALASGLTISGNNTARIFEFEHSTSTIIGLRLIHGAALGGHPEDFGGAIYLVSATLTISNCTLADNRGVFGGAIYNEDSTLTINRCTLARNAAAQGGGIANDGARLTVNDSTLTGNSAGDGGGVFSVNTVAMTINNSTLEGNSGTSTGGGIHLVTGQLNLNNSTLAGNSAGNGGAIIHGPSTVLRINNSTLAGNSATNAGGGIYNNQGTVNLTNAIVAGNTARTNANISGSSLGANSLTNGHPMLAPLGNYGGPTWTMPPLPGSPAINNGGDSVTNFLATDQRGVPRRLGAHVDIGAVEGVFDPDFRLVDARRLGNGSFQFSFENLAGAGFGVMATTNISLPSSNWMRIGFATEIPGGFGRFEFTDPQATNNPAHFYRA